MPILIHSVGFRLHILIHAHLNTLSRLHILIHCRTIAYLNTWLEDPSRFSAAIAYLNTCGSSTPPPPPPAQLRLLLLSCLSRFFAPNFFSFFIAASVEKKVLQFCKLKWIFLLAERMETVMNYVKTFSKHYALILFISSLASSIWTLSLAENTFVYRPSQGKKEGKGLKLTYIIGKCRFKQDRNTFPSYSSSISRGRSFCEGRRKGVELDNRLNIPAPKL